MAKTGEKLIVGCYTPGDYAREAEERLLPSVRSLSLAHDVREIPSRGSWIRNGFACQDFLRDMHAEKPDADFLFLDVDAVVHSDPWPFLSALECDLAAHWFDGRELLTGTLYLPAAGPLGAGGRGELLDCWIYANETNPNAWDQKNLQNLLEENEKFTMARLPAEYCCIFDSQRRISPEVVPVIEHFQASRRLKKGVR